MVCGRQFQGELPVWKATTLIGEGKGRLAWWAESDAVFLAVWMS